MTMESEAVVGKPEGVRGELYEMSQQTVEMLELAWKGFRNQYKGPLELAEKLGREVHQREKALTKLAVKKSAGQAAALGADQEPWERIRSSCSSRCTWSGSGTISNSWSGR